MLYFHIMFRVHIRGDLHFRNHGYSASLEDRGYELGKKIQSGSYGTVYKITRNIDKSDFVLKVIKKKHRQLSVSEYRERVLKEIDIMNKLIHPNIVNIIDFYESDKYFNIVSELCTGGELFDAIVQSETGLSREAVRHIAANLLQAIRYCHEQCIMHRDIKPSNILLTRPYVKGEDFPPVKLIDFGLSTFYTPGIPDRGKVGTGPWMAPEVYYNKFYNEKCDIYSIGCVLFTCLCGSMAFAVSDKRSRDGIRFDRKIYSKGNKMGQDNSIYIGSVWNDLDIEKEFLNSLLDTDQKYRKSAIQALRDPYFEVSMPDIPMPTSNEILSKLKGLHMENKLRRVVKNIIGRKLLPSDREVIQRWFGKQDSMTIKEAIDHIGTYFQYLEQDELKSIAEALDLNKDGIIDKEEFISTVMPSYLYDTVIRIHAAFFKLDLDKNSRLSFDEVRHALFDNEQDTQEIWDALRLNRSEEMTMRKFDLFLERGDWMKPLRSQKEEGQEENNDTSELDDEDNSDFDDDDEEEEYSDEGSYCSVQ